MTDPRQPAETGRGGADPPDQSERADSSNAETSAEPGRSRRDILAAVAGAATTSVAGCGSLGGSGGAGTDDPSVPDFVLHVTFPTFTGNNGKPIRPTNDEVLYRDRNRIIIPYRKELTAVERYTAYFDYGITLQTWDDPGDIGTLKLTLQPDVPVNAEHPDALSGIHGDSAYTVSSDELASGVSINSKEDPGKLSCEFERLESATEATLLPMGVTITAEFVDLDVDVAGPTEFSTTFRAAMPSTGTQNVNKLLSTADTVWSSGREGADALASRSVDAIYNSGKLWTAAASGQLESDLVQNAVVNDIAGFKDPLGNQNGYRTINGDPGKVRALGPIVFGKFPPLGTPTPTPSPTSRPTTAVPVETPTATSAPTGSPTETQTSTDSSTSTDSPTSTGTDASTGPSVTAHRELDARNFEINAVPDGTFKCLYKPSGDRSYPVDIFRLDISSETVNGIFPLSEVTGDQSFDPGDTYLISGNTLGLDTELPQSISVLLQYEARDVWLPLVETEVIPSGSSTPRE